MATTKNITMKQFNGTDYDTLYPKTIAEQVDGIYGKDDILSNGTKALYGLTNSAVPDNVLALLSRFNKGLGNEYMWEKTKSEFVQAYDENGSTNWTIGSNTIYFAESFHIENDNFYLDNPTGPMSSSVDNFKANLGKYAILASNPYSTQMYKIPQDATITSSSGNAVISKYIYYSNPHFDEVVTSYGYVNSPDPNAYPPAVSDGYTYTALGQLGAKTQIATGSYTGTGTYGSDNKCSITFDFEPEFIAISRVKPDNLTTMLAFFTCGCQVYTSFRSASSYASGAMTLNACGYCTWGSNFSFYHTTSAEQQMNLSGIKYNYIAIG